MNKSILNGYKTNIPLCTSNKIEMLWAHNKINRTCKNDPTGHGTRKHGQKKRWQDNISEWTGLELGEALQKAEDREEWRICPVIFDAQTVIQTRG